MFLAFLASVSATSPPGNPALDQCRMAIVRRTGSLMLDESLDATDFVGAWTILQGRFTTAQGPAEPAPPGQVRPPHLVRIDHSFVCWVRAGRVRKLHFR